MHYLILIFLFFTFTFADNYKRILFISSYDLSFPTVKKQLQGIQKALDEKVYQLDVEFMDTKRLNPVDVEFTFFQVLNIKKELLKNYDAILVGDDYALHFVKNYQKAFFYKKPIVFFAVNDIPFAKEVSKNKYITGVIEEQNINETIDLINELHPKDLKITTIIDNTELTKRIINNFTEESLQKVKFLDFSNYTIEEWEKKLRSIPSNKPLLYISALDEKNTQIKEFYQSINLIKKMTNSPLYHSLEYGIGEGLIGGKVVLFEEQGRQAANIVKTILQGKSIDQIEISSTKNKYLFDYEELKKFNLIDKIPENSILINKPKSFFDKPLIDILVDILVLFIIVLLYIGYLLFKLNKNSKKLKEKAKEQSILLSLFDIGDSVLFKWNNDEEWSVQHVSSNVVDLLGFTKEEFLNDNIRFTSCIHKDDRRRVQKEVQENIKKPFFKHEPYRLITKNKKIKWVIDHTVIIRNKENGIVNFLGYIVDITKEKNIQNTLEKLIDSQNNIICLSNAEQISFANKKFYEFFKCNTIEEFQNRNKLLSNLFVENDRFFHLSKIEKGENWMEKIQDFPENERVVAFHDSSFNICAFSVNSNKFDDDLYLLSFTDISETVINQIKLEEKSIRDKLTGAYNREFFDIKYKSIISECLDSNKKLAIAMLDIDYFKKINDKYGHDVGDNVLQTFVKRIEEVSREDDILIRWGGEEFILVLKVKIAKNLSIALENIRKNIENYNFEDIDELTCSIGATIYKKDEIIEETIKRADISVYKAKAAGRNRVVISN